MMTLWVFHPTPLISAKLIRDGAGRYFLSVRAPDTRDYRGNEPEPVTALVQVPPASLLTLMLALQHADVLGAES